MGFSNDSELASAEPLANDYQKAGIMIGLITEDLFFAGKIKPLAESAGWSIEFRPRTKAPWNWTRTPKLIVIDLEIPGCQIETLVASLRETTPDVPILAFAGHALVDQLSAARRAGCDPVVTRGQLEGAVAQLLTQLADQ